MKHRNVLNLCVAIILSCAYYTSGELDTTPENTVGLEGTTVTLSCSATSTDARVMWTEFSTSDEGLRLSDNKNIVPSHPYRDRYIITGGPLEFNLEISNLSLADGARYICQDINALPPAKLIGQAELIVMNGDPVCTESGTVTEGVVVEEQFYWKECDVKYRGNFAPNMTWTGPGQFNNDNSVTEAESWSRISFTADRSIEGGRFVCATRFYVPADLPDEAAQNQPSYEYVFEGALLTVLWGPKNLDISPRQASYDVGDVLTCTADAKPDPTYVWTNLRTLTPEEPGQTFTVTADLVGTEQTMRCNVNSVIEGVQFTADVFANVTVPAITTPTTPGTTTPSTPPPADSPCLDLTGQWTSTNPNALLCIEVDSKGNLLTLIRNGTDLFFVTGAGKTVYNDYKHVGFGGIWPAGSEFGVGAFTGECHRCLGNEILLMSGLARNKAHSTECGTSAGTRLTQLYAFTRFGPPCRNPPGKVYRPSPEHVKLMGILPENIIT